MIFDAEDPASRPRQDRRYDVCVIGSGPAGMTVARRLARHGASVALCEAGGLLPSAQSQALYAGTISGRPYFSLQGTRLRYFGGSSGHWGGWTRPLDRRDFEPNPDNPLSGWPIGKEDLDPYAEQADRILDLPPSFTPPDMFGGRTRNLVPTLFRFSHPVTRLGSKYRKELERSEAIEVYLNANLVALKTQGSAIGEAVFRSYLSSEPFSVRARYHALCLGGLENPRALLNAQLGNEHDLVGRYFLEHLHVPVGRIVVREAMKHMLVYAPSRAFMSGQGILNFGMRMGNFALNAEQQFTGAFRELPACNSSFEQLLAHELAGREAPCAAHIGQAFIACEQALNRESRVRLGSQRDRFGLRKLDLHWELVPRDFRTLRTAAMETAMLMAAHDVGRLKMERWLLEGRGDPTLAQLFGGNHHMGTTRMSQRPEDGVVDRHVRLHALDNLYLGGSSVFASAGASNPTYTIVQLALRLGDHLAAQLS